jgi:uncharacterized protein YifN (PemK superfamily)
MLYKKENGNLIITVPLKTTRSNPYMGDDYHPEMDNIIGLFEKDYENGLCYRLDMDHAGKLDQYSDYFFKLDGTREEFDAMIKELGIDAIYE